MNPAGNKNQPHDSIQFSRDPIHPCPYLPDLIAQDEFVLVSQMASDAYEYMMDLGFRRSGHTVYRPICEGCRQCVPLRVNVQRFRASRSQRRVWRRNQDVTVESGRPMATIEKWQMFKAYLKFQHDGTMSNRREDFEQFLYESPTDTREMVYRVDGRAVGVGLVDMTPDCLSSVYFYFDPADARRSLGVFSTLKEIELCREQNRTYWYGGYYIRDCRRMSYKANYRPYELLGTDGIWRDGIDAIQQSS